MKYTMIRLAIAILLGAVVGNSANAGFGSHGGMFGGGSGGASTGYGSSGGAGYGSSGGVGYGSSGGVGYGSSGGASYSGYGSSGGSYVASYGSSGGGSSGGAASSGGSSGRPGLLSRLHTRVHSHIAAKHARRSYYASSGGGSSGGYAGYGSSGGSSSGGSSGSYYSGYSSVGGGSSGSVSYGSTGSVSYGSTGSSYGSTGSAIHSGYGSAVNTAPYYGASTTTPSATSALVSNSRSDDSVKLNVTVPESAKVYVNDRLTTSTGEVRQFVSRGLESGKSYRFEIRAELNDNGKIVTDTQTVVVTSGSQENVRFPMTAPKAATKVDTAVVLNVPENAEVTLAGNQTQVKGSTRVFKTSQLQEGDVWEDYVIQVKVGEQVKTQSIRLIAGDKLELSFDFDNDASRLAAK